jgi:hypothetical protein
MMFLAADKNTTPCYTMPHTEVVADIDGVHKMIAATNFNVVVKDFAGTWRNGITPYEVVM